MIKSCLYSSEIAGPHVLIFGAVHGNEVCGTLGIKRVMQEFDSGSLLLARGSVEFVPVANPKAHAAEKRSMERNLNRYFLPSEAPANYEARLTNVLARMIKDCDYFIDLHSTTAGGIPFASVEGNDTKENELAAAMGAEVLLFGWHEAYAASGKPSPDPDESIGTTAYARRHGAKAVLLECGQHKDPVAIEVAYRAIHGALSHIGTIAPSDAAPEVHPKLIKTTKVVYRGEGGNFTQNWGNFSTVSAGERVAVLEDGSVIASPADGFIVLPNPTTPPGTEWFYFGETV